VKVSLVAESSLYLVGSAFGFTVGVEGTSSPKVEEDEEEEEADDVEVEASVDFPSYQEKTQEQ
jgi:hypothetical protein